MKSAISGVIDAVAGIAKYVVSLVAGVARVAVTVTKTVADTACDATAKGIDAFESGANDVIDKVTGAADGTTPPTTPTA